MELPDCKEFAKNSLTMAKRIVETQDSSTPKPELKPSSLSSKVERDRQRFTIKGPNFSASIPKLAPIE
jgi:hypothetical protein